MQLCVQAAVTLWGVGVQCLGAVTASVDGREPTATSVYRGQDAVSALSTIRSHREYNYTRTDHFWPARVHWFFRLEIQWTIILYIDYCIVSLVTIKYHCTGGCIWFSVINVAKIVNYKNWWPVYQYLVPCTKLHYVPKVLYNIIFLSFPSDVFIF